MRPPEFTGGKHAVDEFRVGVRCAQASMRPPEFTGGNATNGNENPAAMAALQ